MELTNNKQVGRKARSAFFASPAAQKRRLTLAGSVVHVNS